MREGESVGVGPNLCLSAIVLSPLVGYGGVKVFSSRDNASEGVVLSCSWSTSSTITDLDKNWVEEECNKVKFLRARASCS